MKTGQLTPNVLYAHTLDEDPSRTVTVHLTLSYVPHNGDYLPLASFSQYPPLDGDGLGGPSAAILTLADRLKQLLVHQAGLIDAPIGIRWTPQGPLERVVSIKQKQGARRFARGPFRGHGPVTPLDSRSRLLLLLAE